MIFPEEIENQQFEVSFRGYNTREVDEFLSRVHTELKELIDEHDQFKRKIAAAELIAKDAKDHEEEFIASMANDRNAVNSVLENAKAEGEKIIREAKNAASGIMAEVKRRAADISAESRRSCTEAVETATAEAEDIKTMATLEAEEILAAAFKEAEELKTAAASEAEAVLTSANDNAEKRLFAAKTESENILAAANTEATAILESARSEASSLSETAAETAALYEMYIDEVRTEAEKLCFELDTELRNSASRIALLGKRVAAAEIPEKPELVELEETEVESEADIETADAEISPFEEATEQVMLAEEAEETAEDNGDDYVEPVPTSSEGYFSEEYKLAMSELFGDDAATAEIPTDYVFEDDDTYDYIEQSIIITGETEDEGNDGEDGEDGGDGDVVTSEYSGFGTVAKGVDLSDTLENDVVDQIYKAPSKEDLDDIFNN